MVHLSFDIVRVQQALRDRSHLERWSLRGILLLQDENSIGVRRLRR